MSNLGTAVFNTVVAVIFDPPKIVELICKPRLDEIYMSIRSTVFPYGRSAERILGGLPLATDLPPRPVGLQKSRFCPYDQGKRPDRHPARHFRARPHHCWQNGHASLRGPKLIWRC